MFRQTLKDRWLDFRDRMMQKPAFLRWAARFALTRPMARASTSALFDIVAGFVYTQILTACVEVKLLEQLADGPKALPALAQRCELPEDAMLRLLRAAMALRLASPRSGGRFGLGDLGGALLANPGVLAMIEHHRLVYDDLRDPVALLRNPSQPTGLSRYWAYAQASDPDTLSGQDVGDYSALMAASQGFIAQEVLAAYPLRRHRHLVDMGGGEGRFAQAALVATPGLRATVFDLPAVAERARARLKEAGLDHRGGAVGGDFFGQGVPQGLPEGPDACDIVSLVRILHDHDDEPALAILRKARALLPVGGTLLVAEPMAQTPGAQRAGDAYFGFYLLAMRSGRPRTAQELRGFLAEAGFGSIAMAGTATPLLTRVMTARAL
jgi:demethylspheroidene O-methyltransferase